MWINRLTVIIGLLLCFIFTSGSEEYQLPTSQGETTLIIPDSYNDLRDAYIDMASLYVEERYDHEASLQQIDRLLSLHDEYRDYLRQLDNGTRILIQELAKDSVDILRIYLNGHYRYNVLRPAPNIGVGIQFLLFESFNIQVFYEVPLSIGLSVGGKLY